MNFVIKSSSMVPACKRPIHKRTLAQLLKQFGVAPMRRPDGHFRQVAHRCLWQVADLVRARWNWLRRVLHPDYSGKGYEPFAIMSAIYATIKTRLKAKGILIQ